MRTWTWVCLIVLSLVFVGGCDRHLESPEYQEEIVVFGFLWGGQAVTAERAIFISRTQPITDFFDLDQAAVSGADVTITQCSDGVVYPMEEDEARQGFYFNEALIVQPGVTYALEVRVNADIVQAETTVPSVLNVTSALNADTVNVELRDGLSRLKPLFLESDDTDQVVIVEIYCNEIWENAEIIDPFFEDHTHPESQEEYDGGVDGEPRRIRAMARLREFISMDYPDQSVVDWYSSMIVFYGSNTMRVMAIDDNYHDYLTMENPEFSGGIEGGLGVFGSIYGTAFELWIVKP